MAKEKASLADDGNIKNEESVSLYDEAIAITAEIESGKTLSTQRKYLEMRAQTLLLQGIFLELRKLNGG